jgi:hypothetical protein
MTRSKAQQAQLDAARVATAPSAPSDATPPATDPVTAARVVVERLHAAEAQLARRRLALEDELVADQASAGDAALDAALAGQAPADALRQLAITRDEILATDHAITAARRRRADAIRSYWGAEAEARRREIQPLVTQLAAHEARTAELLAQLTAHEGCAYEPAYVAILARRRGPGEVVAYTIPAGDVMRQRIAELEQQAAALVARPIVDDGGMTAESRAELIDQLLGHDPLILAPAVADVLAWHEQVVAAEHARRRQANPVVRAKGDDRDWELAAEDAPVRVELVWQAGAINQDRSRVWFRKLAHRELPPVPDAPAVVDLDDPDDAHMPVDLPDDVDDRLVPAGQRATGPTTTDAVLAGIIDDVA